MTAEPDHRGVFVSWSGPVSEAIAGHLKPFLEDVLGSATIFMSKAMDGGVRWSTEIPQRLESCNAGLVLVTPENRHAPWLHFEAGALSKRIDESHVIPLLCGATVGEIQGTPLALFQAKNLDHDDFLSVCVSFGKVFGVPEDAVRRRYDKSWSELEAAVAGVKGAGQPKGQLGLSDIMAVLERVASQVTTIESSIKRDGLANALAAYSSGGALNGLTLGSAHYGVEPPPELHSLARNLAELAGDHPLRTNALKNLQSPKKA